MSKLSNVIKSNENIRKELKKAMAAISDSPLEERAKYIAEAKDWNSRLKANSKLVIDELRTYHRYHAVQFENTLYCLSPDNALLLIDLDRVLKVKG